MNVRLTKDQKIKIGGPSDIYAIMQQILMRENRVARNKEHCWIMGLANNNSILFIELISLGTVNAILLNPMEVFSFALQKRAVSIVIVHNHPSGELKPSAADMDTTDHMIQVGLFLQVPVLDHLIITETGHYSFENEGLLEKLAESKKYALHFIEEEKLKKSKAVEIAKVMKEKGMTAKQIVEMTGLSKKEVEGL